jgi:hypothetical protein
MLTPSKHLDLDKSVIRVASEVLTNLRRHRVMQYDAVTRLIKRRAGDDSDAVVAPALSFLFLIGRIEYHAINDTFEYRARP